ncbi:Sphingosine N-acyltransferase lag1 [Coemansia guatemalensis]|uniref:Sphingosine N-acyltransferase lag1 n=1 Tax=Coemansia guatemalensis TaxID=2761395 RepID=A0A9W8HWV3_9FUNG|nr:Sphingosine N-acyltransferase lag1 [Coemansia guatemalensis]
MPPLEKRQPHAMAISEHSQNGLVHRIVNDPSAETDDPVASYKLKARRLRQRRQGLPSAELSERSPAASIGSPRALSLSKFAKRNVVLSSHHPVIVWLSKNELSLPLTVLCLVHFCQWVGYEWPSAWFSIQHSVGAGSEQRYVRGVHDATFVVCWVLRIVAARAVMLHHVLPLVPRLLGVKSARKIRRFGESGWFLSYIIFSLSIGFRTWQQSPYYMNTRSLYSNYPEEHALMPYDLKWYYLVQTAFWISNVYTIFVEERRKDHMEMLAHHVVTIALVVSSYYFHFTRFGHAFMLVMDFPDIFLSSAKLLRYLGYMTVPNILFGAFTVSWVFTKHYLCLKMMLSIWTEGPQEIPYEKQFPRYPNSYASYPIVIVIWIILCVLQAILIYWFVMILRVLQRVLIQGKDAADNRSDDEEDGESDESTVCESKPTAEQG